ncbi:unnamed protein product [Ambrosiozyma monospora]|uniref:Unnamed protein product n=1 Tax=Ambrosiozyma monospora TaxID=43982 RepID=A0ACB5U467_AMBMO|nr:unnamed protein product [Ambrosiozyma monospora]
MDQISLKVVSSDVVSEAQSRLHWIDPDKLFKSSTEVEDSKIVEVKEDENSEIGESGIKVEGASLCEESVIEKRMDLLMKAYLTMLKR